MPKSQPEKHRSAEKAAGRSPSSASFKKLMAKADNILEIGKKVIDFARPYIEDAVEKRNENRTLKPDMVYTPKEVARLLKVKEDEILELLDRGAIKGNRFGREYRVLGCAVLDYFERGCQDVALD